MGEKRVNIFITPLKAKIGEYEHVFTVNKTVGSHFKGFVERTVPNNTITANIYCSNMISIAMILDTLNILKCIGVKELTVYIYDTNSDYLSEDFDPFKVNDNINYQDIIPMNL